MIGLLKVFKIELGRIFSLKPAFAVMVMSILLYSVFYPQPYKTEALRDVPIALVDLDNTDSSRQLARNLDASSDVRIEVSFPDEITAERAIYQRDIYGIVVIPRFFERDLLHGRSSPIALYADASYFLIQSRISGAVSAVAKTMGAQVETSRLIASQVDPAIAAAVPDPMPTTAVTLFNPEGGYATYILPAAFILLLQQTLLIGVGLLGTYQNRDLAEFSAQMAGPFSRVLGKLLAYLVLEAIILPFYLIALPYLYGIPRLGSVGNIAVVAIPFVIAVAALGMVIARAFKNPMVVQMVSASIGMPFMFLAGFSWPAEAMPLWLRYIATAVPTTTAINAIVEVAQMGATLSDVRSEVLTLGALAAIYFAIAVILEGQLVYKRKPINANA